MRLVFLSLLLVVFSLNTHAQTVIGGVINSYSAVTSVDICNNRAAVFTTAGFNVGDRVMLIQMNGADIDLADAASYGTVSNIGDAGNYEILTIASINVNIVEFQERIMRDYDVAESVQMVSVPQYTNALIDSVLTCYPWDGNIGGVLALEVSGILTFNSDIDVSSRGFRGGSNTNNPGCYAPGGYTGYRCNGGAQCGGRKGEGIGNPGGNSFGRGAPANGGGGGNAHNTGGGGGSNLGIGGQGGERLNAGGQCAGSNPGLGGHALTYSNADNKIFMGGGGGAGDQNNGTATAGEAGGGIVMNHCRNDESQRQEH